MYMTIILFFSSLEADCSEYSLPANKPRFIA